MSYFEVVEAVTIQTVHSSELKVKTQTTKTRFVRIEISKYKYTRRTWNTHNSSPNLHGVQGIPITVAQLYTAYMLIQAYSICVYIDTPYTEEDILSKHRYFFKDCLPLSTMYQHFTTEREPIYVQVQCICPCKHVAL